MIESKGELSVFLSGSVAEDLYVLNALSYNPASVPRRKSSLSILHQKGQEEY